MTDPAIIEAAARALACLPGDDELHRDLAMRVLAAVTPLIRAADAKLIEENVADLVAMTRAATLEEAARVAEEAPEKLWHVSDDLPKVLLPTTGADIAAAIRALKYENDK